MALPVKWVLPKEFILTDLERKLIEALQLVLNSEQTALKSLLSKARHARVRRKK